MLPKFKVGVLGPIQQPGSYWDRSSVLLLVEFKPTKRCQPVIRCQNLLTIRPLKRQNASKECI